MSSIALVIFFVDCTPRMRRRSRRRRAPKGLSLLLRRLAADALHLLLVLLALQLVGLGLLGRALGLRRRELFLELLHGIAQRALELFGQRALSTYVLVDVGVLVLQE